MRGWRVWVVLAALLVTQVSHGIQPVLAAGAVIVVAPSGGDYSTIQAAVNNAADGDVIAVKTGVYAENIDISLMGSAIGGGPGDLTLAADPPCPDRTKRPLPDLFESGRHVGNARGFRAYRRRVLDRRPDLTMGTRRSVAA